MEVGALAAYERALRSARPLGLRSSAGDLIQLDVPRWLADVDAADRTVLARCRGPVLDVGCGPGRFVHALTSSGVPALGVDIAESAVALTRRQGRQALIRDVFAALPGERRWPTVLVMDGNVGIGGDPARLLRRLESLLAPAGRLLVETHAEHRRDDRLFVRFADRNGPTGPEFRWAQVGTSALRRYADESGCRIVETWAAGERRFAALGRG